MTYGTHLVPNSALTKRRVAWVRNYKDDTTIKVGAMAWESYDIFTGQSPEPLSIAESTSVPPEPEDLPPLDRRRAFLHILQHYLATDRLLVSIPPPLVPGNIDLQAMILNRQVHRGRRTNATSFRSIKDNCVTLPAGFTAVNHPNSSHVPDTTVSPRRDALPPVREAPVADASVRDALPAASDLQLPNERHTKRSYESDSSDSDSDHHATILLVHLSNQIRRYRRESRRRHQEILKAIRKLRGGTE